MDEKMMQYNEDEPQTREARVYFLETRTPKTGKK